ncbi:HYDIN protein, partial [Geococcyx californianus]|nr:HYDIN protein [Geococcyx californianus]
VRVSAKAVFSKYSIYPASFINFGVMLKGTRKTCTFTLENKGILNFKFLIYRALPRTSAMLLAGDAESKAVGHQSLLELFLQARLTLGMFTVYPGFGVIPPGSQQMITVDCYAEPLGTCKEHLSIDISHR